ncbi:MAG: hypothetical protein JKY93_06925 [Gammaproteobacteria bacterium]|nr:hypothetical protein [Gammaproteobacteria bacterium]
MSTKPADNDIPVLEDIISIGSHYGKRADDISPSPEQQELIDTENKKQPTAAQNLATDAVNAATTSPTVDWDQLEKRLNAITQKHIQYAANEMKDFLQQTLKDHTKD